MRWATLPCPAGARGRCRCAGSTLFALRAKALQSGAPDFGLSRGRAGRWGGLPIRNGWQARRENGKRTAIHADCVSKMSQAASPCAWACRRLRAAAPSGTNRSLSAPCSRGRQASTSSQRRCQPALPARRALPAPAQGINPLRIPFWGNGSRCFPAAPSPTPQAASPCAWACRRLFPPPLQPERNEAPKPPTRGAWARLLRANGTGRRHCRPLPG